MKAVTGKVFRMFWQLVASRSEDVANDDAVLRAELLNLVIEANDRLLRLWAHRYRHPSRGGDIREVAYDNDGAGLVLQSRQNLIKILVELIQRYSMSNVVDADSYRYQLWVGIYCATKLRMQHVGAGG